MQKNNKANKYNVSSGEKNDPIKKRALKNKKTRYFTAIKKYIRNLTDYFKFCSQKKATTLAGALAYFLFAGFVPFAGLLAFAAKMLGIPAEQIESTLYRSFGGLSLLAEENVSFAISRVKTLFLALTSLYSAGHFYSHILKSGEIICKTPPKSGIKSKLKAFAALGSVGSVFLCALAFDLFGQAAISALNLPEVASFSAYYMGGVAVNVCLCALLIKFASPRSYSIKDNIKGVVLCFFVWEITGAGFAVWQGLKPTYNTALSAVMFTLYLYFMMLGVTYGLCLNAYSIKTKGRKKAFSLLQSENS